MKRFTIFLLLTCCILHAPVVAQEAATTTDTVAIVDEDGRVIKRLKDGYVVEEIEYPKSKPITIADVETTLPWFKSESFTYTLQAGDIAVIEVKPVANNKLREVSFSNSKGGLLVNQLDVRKGDCFCKRIQIEETDDYSLTIHDSYINFKNKASIHIVRYPKPEAVVYNIIRDTIYSEEEEVVRTEVTQRDTLIYQLLDEKLTVSNKLDFERKPYNTCRISIPSDTSLHIQQIYYWIGLSGQDTLQYQELEAKISLPPALIPLTTSPALVAYALNKRIPLPTTLNNNIHYAFTDLGNKIRFEQGKKSYKTLVGKANFSPPNFGHFSLHSIRNKYPLSAQAAAEGVYDIYLNFRNNSSVNRYPIQVKAIGFGIKTTTKNILAKRIIDIKTYRIQQTVAE